MYGMARNHVENLFHLETMSERGEKQTKPTYISEIRRSYQSRINKFKRSFFSYSTLNYP